MRRSSTRRSWSRYRVGLVCAVALLVAAGLAGCSYSSPTQPAAQATLPAAGATATSTSGTVMPSIEVPTSTTSWQTYTDSTYHFKTVIPPGWRIGTTFYPVDNITYPCSYDVIYFPPGDTHHADPYGWMQMKEVMVIFVYLNCPPPDERPNHLPAESAVVVTVSGVSATMYREDNSDGVLRLTFVHFSDHIYDFYVKGTAADGSLYMRVLRGFVHAAA